jgi:hypothetical protein
VAGTLTGVTAAHSATYDVIVLTASSSDSAPSLKERKHCEQFAEAAGKYFKLTLSPRNCTLSPDGDLYIF